MKKRINSVTLNPQYIKDDQGNKIFVVIPFKNFETMIEELQELDNVLIFDESKLSNEALMSIQEDLKKIESKRKKLK